MDFEKLLEQCKFLYHWKDEGDVIEMEVVELQRDLLLFSPSYPLPGGDCPGVTVSFKVNNIWYEHTFDQTEWFVNEQGRIAGLRLIGPDTSLYEWRKNLEIGLCI